MLRIRPPVVREFQDLALCALIEWLIAQVRDIWPEECARMGSDIVPSIVEESVNAAMGNGFIREYDIARFVHLTFAFECVEFYEMDWVKDAWCQPEMSPPTRMNLLWTRVRCHFDVQM